MKILTPEDVLRDLATLPQDYKTADVDDLYNKVKELLHSKQKVVYKPELSVPDEIEKLYALFGK